MATALEKLRFELESPNNQDIPMESIKDVLGELLDDVESEMSNGNSGSQPVGCVLFKAATVIPSDTPGVVVWDDELLDNVTDENELDAFPDGLGLDGYGTDTLTTTEAGVWAFTLLNSSLPPDATWSGYFNFGNYNLTGISLALPVNNGAHPRQIREAQMLKLPVGTGFSLLIETIDSATADPYQFETVTLGIVRLK